MCTREVGQLVLSERTKVTIMGLIAMGNAGCQVKVEGNTQAAKAILSTTLSNMHVYYELNVKGLLESMYWRVDHYSADTVCENSDFEIPEEVNSPKNSLPGLPDAYLEGKPWIEPDFLVDSDYENLFFITVFLSAIRITHIDPSTPLISSQELETARVHRKSTFLNPVPELVLPRFSSNSRAISVCERRKPVLQYGATAREHRCLSRKVDRRSPSLGAHEMLVNGRLKLRKLSQNLRKLRVEAVKRSRVKSNIMLRFDPVSSTEVCYTPT